MPNSHTSSAAAARLERAELREAQRSARGNTQQPDDTVAKVTAKAEVAADMEAEVYTAAVEVSLLDLTSLLVHRYLDGACTGLVGST